MLTMFRQQITVKRLIFLFSIVYLFPKKFLLPPGLGVDASWQLSLLMAGEEGLMWGRDIAFTYGPLGYWLTRVHEGFSALPVIGLGLFVAINAIYFLYFLFKRIEKTEELIIWSVALFLNGYFLFQTDSITLYLFLVFHVFHFLNFRNTWSLLIISICGIVTFYGKVNSGIIANVIIAGFILYNFILPSYSRVKNAVFAIIHFGTLWLLAKPLSVDLWPYVKNSMPIVDAYNDAMFLILPDVFKLFVAVVIITLMVSPFVVSFKKSIVSLYEVFLLGNVALLYFTLFKQGFVRADAHLNVYFAGVAFVVVLVLFFSRIDETRPMRKNSVLIAVLLSVTGYVGLRGEVLDMNMGKSIFVPHAELSPEQKKKERALPADVLQKIGSSTVDFLGYETSYIFYNKLHYNPRPSFQSYSAYHPHLVMLNVAKYESEHAPEYVFYRFGSIGERHPFWDEPRLFLTLLEHYTIDDTIPSAYGNPPLILFKRAQSAKPFTEKVLLDTVVTLNSAFPIPSSNHPVYMYAETEYTTVGKIRRTLFQPSPLSIQLRYADDSESTHSYLIPLMTSGVPINKRILTPAEANMFFSLNSQAGIETSSATITGGSKWVQNTIRLRFVEYSRNE
jgi:hypothetical protein